MLFALALQVDFPIIYIALVLVKYLCEICVKIQWHFNVSVLPVNSKYSFYCEIIPVWQGTL